MNVRVTIVTIADLCPATSQMKDLPDPSLRRLPAPGAWTFRHLDRATAHSGGPTSRVDRTPLGLRPDPGREVPHTVEPV